MKNVFDMLVPDFYFESVSCLIAIIQEISGVKGKFQGVTFQVLYESVPWINNGVEDAVFLTDIDRNLPSSSRKENMF